MDLRAFESADPRWMTYQQAHEKNWQVRKGERSTTIFFTKPLEVDDEETEDAKRTIRLLKHYAVFHASQIDGIPAYKVPSVEEAPWARPEAADIIMKNSGAVIRIGGDRAFYSPSTDHIQFPPESAFRGQAEYTTTELHELGHWTGHPSRLNRPLQNRFGSAANAMEELRAEMASAFVASMLSIPTDVPQHASYISSWIKALKNDKREIFRAAADAQRIADRSSDSNRTMWLSWKPKLPPLPPHDVERFGPFSRRADHHEFLVGFYNRNIGDVLPARQ